MTARRTLIAHHEAGHATVAERLGHRVAMVSIEPGVSAGVKYRGCYELTESLPGDHPDIAPIALAGLLAECRLLGYAGFERWCGRCRRNRYDIEQALHSAPDEASFNRAIKRSVANSDWGEITNLAAALEQRGTLTGAELGLRFLKSANGGAK